MQFGIRWNRHLIRILLGSISATSIDGVFVLFYSIFCSILFDFTLFYEYYIFYDILLRILFYVFHYCVLFYYGHRILFYFTPLRSISFHLMKLIL
jgi:hypothetical protein